MIKNKKAEDETITFKKDILRKALQRASRKKNIDLQSLAEDVKSMKKKIELNTQKMEEMMKGFESILQNCQQ